MRVVLASFGVLAVAAALASEGCASDTPSSHGSGGSSAADSSSGGDDVSCVDDSRVDTYTAKLAKPGELGVLSFELVSSTPAPPAKGPNTFEVVVTDADGAPLAGRLGVELVMPDHGHGTQVPPVVTLNADASSYQIKPVYLFMPGVWRVELDYYGDSADDAATDAVPVDQATFFFCIEG
jgi:hypothetical protein